MPREPKQELTFAEARSRLDAILAELESDAGDVDQLAARLQEASELIRFCRDRLSAARHEVKKVVAELHTEPAAEAEEPPPGDEGPPLEDEPEAARGAGSGPGPGDLPF